jgi:CheY-like chemotaxis protein
MRLSAIIVDLMLSGDSGTTLLGYIRAHPRLKSVKSIMMSGYDHAEATARVWKADVFLKKPVTISGLLESLRKIGVALDGVST